MKRLARNQSGLTIVELMIATAVFSMVLLICAMAIVHVGRMYYKGMIMNRTQDTARQIAEDIAQSIQFGAFENASLFVVPAGAESDSIRAWCIGESRYTFRTDFHLGGSGSPHVLWRDRRPSGASCAAADVSDASLSDGEELLGANMRAPRLEVSAVDGIWTISIRIAYGDDPELFEPAVDGEHGPFEICKGTNAGGQFCAVSSFTTSVVKRL